MPLEKFLTVDPGENTGWSVWNGNKLVTAGQTPMWQFADGVWRAAIRTQYPEHDPTFLEEGAELPLDELIAGIELVVIENWALYPWVISTGAMDWDECRTARLIGAIFEACRFAGWSYEQQPALIKERAIAAGAESYFAHPLHENRHANDAIMHGCYRNAKASGAQWADLSTKKFVV